MSNSDREIWDKRYRDGSYSARIYPSQVVVDWLDQLPRGRALDIACGSGRNAVFLAEVGYDVVGVDISHVALQKARKLAAARGVAVEWILQDLDLGLPVLHPFDLITMVRFVERQIIANIDRHLSVGGCALFEQHIKLEIDRPLVGPTNDAFRVEPGEIQQLISHMEIINEFEGIVRDPDDRESALVRILARKI